MAKNPIPPRGVIYPKDIQNMTGLSIISAYRMLSRTRKMLNKPRRALVLVEEFCQCTNFSREFVDKYIR